MNTLLWLLVAIATFWSLLYFRVTLLWSSLAVAAVALLWSYVGDANIIAKTSVWILLAGVTIPLNITALRRHYLSSKVLALFRQVMPSMSQTEKEAFKVIEEKISRNTKLVLDMAKDQKMLPKR